MQIEPSIVISPLAGGRCQNHSPSGRGLGKEHLATLLRLSGLGGCALLWRRCYLQIWNLPVEVL